MKQGVLALGLVLAVSSAPAVAKKEPQLSGLELQQMQARDVETNKKVAFAAVMSVLQDSGYRIGSTDYDSGLITGVASSKTKMTWLPFVGFGTSKKTPVVSAFIEDRTPTLTRIRLNFVMGKIKNGQLGGTSDETPILDGAVYRDAFEKINQAIFLRQATDGAPATPVSPTTPSPASVTPTTGS